MVSEFEALPKRLAVFLARFVYCFGERRVKRFRRDRERTNCNGISYNSRSKIFLIRNLNCKLHSKSFKVFARKRMWKLWIFLCVKRKAKMKRGFRQVENEDSNRFRQFCVRSKIWIELLKFCFRCRVLSHRILYDLIERVFIRCLIEQDTNKKWEKRKDRRALSRCVLRAMGPMCVRMTQRKIDNMNKLFDYRKLCSSCSSDTERQNPVFMGNSVCYCAADMHIFTLCIAHTLCRLAKIVAIVANNSILR